MTSEKPLLLVVEDDPVQQKVILILTEKFGFLAVVVNTGQEALSALSACNTGFDVILMDWKMPDMDGIECTRRIRQLERAKSAHTPIIAVTAYAMESDRKICMEAGMDDYLSKPFSADDFRRVLLKWAYNAARPNLRLLPGSKDDKANSAQ